MTNFGELTDWYRRSCLTCGALITDKPEMLQLHAQWHRELEGDSQDPIVCAGCESGDDTNYGHNFHPGVCEKAR